MPASDDRLWYGLEAAVLKTDLFEMRKLLDALKIFDWISIKNKPFQIDEFLRFER